MTDDPEDTGVWLAQTIELQYAARHRNETARLAAELLLDEE